MWDLPHNTHTRGDLLPLPCDVLPLMDQLSCRCAKFIANALHSDSDVASYVAFLSVGCCRRLAEIHISAAREYGVSLYDIYY